MTLAAETITASACLRIFLNHNYFKSALGKMGRGDNAADARADDNYRFLFHNFLRDR
jgi:hypothetical protein